MTALFLSARSFAETPSLSAATRIGVPCSSVPETMRTSCPAIRMYRLKTSEGTPKPATWPMWRGPFAYGQATADRTLLMGWILGVGANPVVLGHHAGVAGARAQGFRAASAALYSSLRLSP